MGSSVVGACVRSVRAYLGAVNALPDEIGMTVVAVAAKARR
jgi:hypothetical protein